MLAYGHSPQTVTRNRACSTWSGFDGGFVSLTQGWSGGERERQYYYVKAIPMFDRPGATVARLEVTASATFVVHHQTVFVDLRWYPLGYFHAPRGQAGLMRWPQNGCSWATGRARVSFPPSRHRNGTCRRTTRSVSCPRSALCQHCFKTYTRNKHQRPRHL